MEPQTCTQKKSKLLGYLLSTIQLVLGIMMDAQPKAPKSELLGYFTFNTSTCTWDDGYTHNLQHQKK
jgi:hypothetical protein